VVPVALEVLDYPVDPAGLEDQDCLEVLADLVALDFLADLEDPEDPDFLAGLVALDFLADLEDPEDPDFLAGLVDLVPLELLQNQYIQDYCSKIPQFHLILMLGQPFQSHH
jgi:hypothetical protein